MDSFDIEKGQGFFQTKIKLNFKSRKFCETLEDYLQVN